MKRKEIIKKLEEMEQRNAKSQWKRGVYATAIDRIDEMDADTKITWYSLLNGALWSEKQATFENILNACDKYAWGGCGLCYNIDIAELLCTKSQIYYKNGTFKSRPNGREEWLDMYARAIYQAFYIIMRHFANETIED